MKTAFFLLLVGCCQAHAAITIEAPRQRGEIHCKQVLELKDIFDGGFRPYRIIDKVCRG